MYLLFAFCSLNFCFASKTLSNFSANIKGHQSNKGKQQQPILMAVAFVMKILRQSCGNFFVFF